MNKDLSPLANYSTRPGFADPRLLKSHPKRDALTGRLPVSTEEENALHSSVAQGGVTTPVVLCSKGYVLDGMLRVEAAVKAGHDEVPCINVGEGGEALAIYNGLFYRRHVSKSALAFIAWPLVADIVAAARERQMGCLKRGSDFYEKPNESPSVTEFGTGTLEEFQSNLPFSHPLRCAAEEIHGYLGGAPVDSVPRLKPENREKMRLFVETQLFVKGANILKWKVWISGKQSTRSDLEEGPTQRTFNFVGLENATETLARRLDQPGLWKDPASVSRVKEMVAKVIGGMSTEAKELFWQALKDAETKGRS